MSTIFPSFSNGDTNYVTKLNGNFSIIASMLDGINSVLAGSSGGGTVSTSAAYQALFGTTVSVIGAASYGCTGSGATLTVAAGFVWSPSLGKVLQQISSSTLDFTGQAAGTYYVAVDATGAPSRNDTLVANAIYSVVWTGSAFGAITRLAAVVWGAADDIAAQSSAALSASYTTLDARFEAVEALAAVVSDPELSALAALTSAADKIPYFTGSGTAALLTRDIDGALAANSDTVIATQKAVKTYVDNVVTGGAAGFMVFKGVIDCSANPNYPAATAGAVYKVSVAGKLGGASGVVVEVGDTAYCTTTAASGDQATVGTSWNIAQENIDGAVTGPASATDGHVALFNGSTGKIIKDSGLTLAGTNTGDETGTRVATLLHAASAKTTPVDADELTGTDSAASFGLIRITWANIKATLKAYFDTLYAPVAAQPMVVVPFYPGAPTASVLMCLFAAPAGVTTLTFAAALAGSSGKALTAAAAQTDFDVRKDATTSANGTSVGTIRFAAGGTVPTFIAASGFTLTGGTNWLTVWAPATPDATLANISASLYCTKS